MNNRGSVLIFVLIFIAFCASTVIYIYDKSIDNYSTVAGDFYQNQSDIYAMTAMSAVTKLIKDDDNSYDEKGEDWANIPITAVPYGDVTISVTPLNSRIALNRMASGTDDQQERYLDACQRVLDNQDVTSITCGEIKDYIDSDSDTSTGGRENATYTYNGVEFHTKNAPLESMKELQMLFSNQDDFEKVKNYFTTDDNDGLNINFASADVIRMLLPEISDYADKIVEHTENGEFKDVSALQSEIGIPADVYTEILPYVSVKSSLFYVKTEVTLNGKSRYYHAIISKNVSTVKATRFLAGIDGQYY